MKKGVLFLFIILVFMNFSVYAAGDENIIFLHHSTGGNVYNYPAQGVASWFSNYNLAQGTNYQINDLNFPNTPYPWANYPYDYWNIWINPSYSCSYSNPSIGCLDYFTNNYDVIIWKHCYPGSDIFQEAATANPADKTIENYKAQYRLLRAEMDQYPDKLFIIWTLPPRRQAETTLANAQRAVEFTNWVKNDWLNEDGSSHSNIYIFDFRDIVATDDGLYLRPEYESSDSHPNSVANNIAGPLFAQFIVDAINVFSGEPVMSYSGDGNLLWKEDFEDQNFRDTFWSTRSNDSECEGIDGNGYSSIDLTNYLSRDGDYSLRYDSCYVSNDPLTGKPGCNNVRLSFGDLEGLSAPSGNKFPMQINITETNETFVRYWVRYEPDNDPVLGAMSERYLDIDMYPGFYGYTYFLSNLDNLFGNPMTARYYYYISPRTYTNPLSSVYIRDGDWHKMEFYVKYNENGLDNGIIQGWVDDQLVLDWVGGIAYYNDGRPRIVKLNTFSNAFDFCTYSPLQIDDFEVWDGLPNISMCSNGYITSLCECGGSARDSGYCLNNEWDTQPFVACDPSPEICDDNIDNDCDGLTDCEDSACLSSNACNLECSNATIKITAKDAYVLYFNGEYVGQDSTFGTVDSYNVRLKEGNNAVAVNAFFDDINPEFIAEINYCGNKVLTDSSWKTTGSKPYGWMNRGYDESSWNNAYTITGTAPVGIDAAARWIWSSDSNPGAQAGYDIGWFRKDFNIAALPAPPCEIISADWSSTDVQNGDTVRLRVQGNNYCHGETINFSMFEYDAGTSDYSDVTAQLANLPPSITFNGVWANQTWVAEWILDEGFLVDENPEYIFNASLADNSDSILSNNVLSVDYLISSCGYGLISIPCDCGGTTYYPGDGYCCAGEFSLTECVITEVIVDNDDPSVTSSGTWSSSTYYSGYYGANYMYSIPETQPGLWYQWNTDLSGGLYEVYAWWTAASDRPYDINYSINGISAHSVNNVDQRINGGQWNLLGTYEFDGVSNVRVITGQTGIGGTCADAVRFLKVGDISGNCQLTNALWNGVSGQQIVNEGESVTLVVNGNDCDGQAIHFTILDVDSNSGPDLINPSSPPNNVNFIGNSAVGSWVVEWFEDLDGIDTTADYIFNATLVSNVSENIAVTYPGNMLQVPEPAVVGCTIDSDCDSLDLDTCSAELIVHHEGQCIANECSYNVTTIQNCTTMSYMAGVWNQCNLTSGDIYAYGHEYTCAAAQCVQTGVNISLFVANDCNDVCAVVSAGSIVADQDLCYNIAQTTCPQINYPQQSCIGGIYVTYACSAGDAVNTTINCDALDGLYNTGLTQWVPNDQCTEKEQIQQEYREYSCSISGCQYTISFTQFVDSGNIRSVLDGTTCDDGLFCSENDQCTAGSCGGTPINCVDSYSCTDDSCNETSDSCTNIENDANCNPGEVCDIIYFNPPTGCGVITSCTGQPNGASCNDGVFCNGPDQCNNQICLNVGPAVNVDDGVSCTVDSCNEATGTIIHTPNNSLCLDGLYCNGAETCNAVLDCQSGINVLCNDGNSSTTDVCDEGSSNSDNLGECVYTPISNAASQTIILSPGWNLVSVDIDAVVNSADLQSFIVMRYENNAWVMDFNGNNEFGLNPLEGYYVYSSQSRQVVLDGENLVSGYRYDLINETWNLFGVSEMDSYNNIYSDIPYTAFSLFAATESGVSEISLDSLLVPGNFYWVNLRGPEFSPPESSDSQPPVEGILEAIFRNIVGYVVRNVNPLP